MNEYTDISNLIWLFCLISTQLAEWFIVLQSALLLLSFDLAYMTNFWKWIFTWKDHVHNHSVHVETLKCALLPSTTAPQDAHLENWVF